MNGLKRSFLRKVLSLMVILCYIFSYTLIPVSNAQMLSSTSISLPQIGTMIPLTSNFNPTLVRGLNINPDNPLRFDFIIDRGDAKLDDAGFNDESNKLIKYFLASLTIPETQMWVNLSPYEKNRIITDNFGKTEMGRDLLAQDYLLKQITASLMNPDGEIGKDFWQKIYDKAYEKFGSTNVPADTFNKVWIVPEEAQIYEHAKGAFVVSSRLKVMLEEDYLALEANKGRTDHGLGNVNESNLKQFAEVSKQMVREVIVPALENEVNNGKTFAPLRQIYNSMLLASWYKGKLKDSLLGQKYANQEKIDGIEIDPKVNQEIYDQYVESFKKGVYNFVKEEYDPVSQEIIPRKYFSGGVGLDKTEISTKVDSAVIEKEIASIKDPAMLTWDAADTFSRALTSSRVGFADEIATKNKFEYIMNSLIEKQPYALDANNLSENEMKKLAAINNALLKLTIKKVSRDLKSVSNFKYQVFPASGKYLGEETSKMEFEIDASSVNLFYNFQGLGIDRRMLSEKASINIVVRRLMKMLNTRHSNRNKVYSNVNFSMQEEQLKNEIVANIDNLQEKDSAMIVWDGMDSFQHAMAVQKPGFVNNSVTKTKFSEFMQKVMKSNVGYIDGFNLNDNESQMLTALNDALIELTVKRHAFKTVSQLDESLKYQIFPAKSRAIGKEEVGTERKFNNVGNDEIFKFVALGVSRDFLSNDVFAISQEFITYLNNNHEAWKRSTHDREPTFNVSITSSELAERINANLASLQDKDFAMISQKFANLAASQIDQKNNENLESLNNVGENVELIKVIINDSKQMLSVVKVKRLGLDVYSEEIDNYFQKVEDALTGTIKKANELLLEAINSSDFAMLTYDKVIDDTITEFSRERKLKLLKDIPSLNDIEARGMLDNLERNLNEVGIITLLRKLILQLEENESFINDEELLAEKFNKYSNLILGSATRDTINRKLIELSLLMHIRIELQNEKAVHYANLVFDAVLNNLFASDYDDNDINAEKFLALTKSNKSVIQNYLKAEVVMYARLLRRNNDGTEHDVILRALLDSSAEDVLESLSGISGLNGVSRSDFKQLQDIIILANKQRNTGDFNFNQIYRQNKVLVDKISSIRSFDQNSLSKDSAMVSRRQFVEFIRTDFSRTTFSKEQAFNSARLEFKDLTRQQFDFMLDSLVGNVIEQAEGMRGDYFRLTVSDLISKEKINDNAMLSNSEIVKKLIANSGLDLLQDYGINGGLNGDLTEVDLVMGIDNNFKSRAFTLEMAFESLKVGQEQQELFKISMDKLAEDGFLLRLPDGKYMKSSLTKKVFEAIDAQSDILFLNAVAALPRVLKSNAVNFDKERNALNRFVKILSASGVEIPHFNTLPDLSKSLKKSKAFIKLVSRSLEIINSNDNAMVTRRQFVDFMRTDFKNTSFSKDQVFGLARMDFSDLSRQQFDFIFDSLIGNVIEPVTGMQGNYFRLSRQDAALINKEADNAMIANWLFSSTYFDSGVLRNQRELRFSPADTRVNLKIGLIYPDGRTPVKALEVKVADRRGNVIESFVTRLNQLINASPTQIADFIIQKSSDNAMLSEEDIRNTISSLIDSGAQTISYETIRAQLGNPLINRKFVMRTLVRMAVSSYPTNLGIKKYDVDIENGVVVANLLSTALDHAMLSISQAENIIRKSFGNDVFSLEALMASFKNENPKISKTSILDVMFQMEIEGILIELGANKWQMINSNNQDNAMIVDAIRNGIQSINNPDEALTKQRIAQKISDGFPEIGTAAVLANWSGLEASAIVSKVLGKDGLFKINRNVGGIDLNPAITNMNVSTDGVGVDLNFDNTDFSNIEINGIVPVIINIAPIANLPMLLGFKDEVKEKQLAKG